MYIANNLFYIYIVAISVIFDPETYEVVEGNTAVLRLITNIAYDFDFLVEVDTSDITTTSIGKRIYNKRKHLYTCIHMYIIYIYMYICKHFNLVIKLRLGSEVKVS